MGIWGILDMALNCAHLGYRRYGPLLWEFGVYQIWPLIVGIWGIEDMALNRGHLGYIRYGP